MIAILTVVPFALMLPAARLGRNARWAAALAICPAALALCFGILLYRVDQFGPVRESVPWAQSLGLSASFHADGLGLLFATIISGVGCLIVLFSSRYFEGDPRRGRFLAVLFAFMGSMLGVVLSDNLFVLFVFWELTGFTSFLLIGFESDSREARTSAIQALVVTGTGGMGLLAGAVLIGTVAGSYDVSALVSRAAFVRGTSAYPWIVVLVLLAAFTKSAQTPFHFWLPNAMTAPTPVSAYLHSATMVKAGLYLVARMTPLLAGTSLWTGLVTGAGALTMAAGAWRSAAETDLKRVLAYSTVSALGVMMMLLGLGTREAVTAAVVYLVAHACYKGALFLIAGTLEHETGSRDIRELSGLRGAMPLIANAGLLAALSMAGVPLLAGFVGKELTYGALLGYAQPWATVLLSGTVLSSSLLGAAGLVAGVSPFVGLPGRAAPKHGVPMALSIPPLVLASLGLVTGVLPSMLDPALRLTTASVLGTSTPVHLSVWHGFSLVLSLSILTLIAAALLYVQRNAIRNRIWPRSLGFERLYTDVIRVLDLISARSLPALQDASLRSYVLVLIITATSLLTGVLAWQGLPLVNGVTEIRLTEAAIAVLTIAGAISAVRARATMTAVLSLGVTGYGAALIFLFYGAPDLAMTQFSVETLTATIFTLVFYHFRKFRSLSRRSIRLRDLTIAVLFGGALAAVLFFVGATTTPFTVGRYFAENSAAMAHGRNIVNVILVDFRALDTMGEITVLATAAVGVRALLKIGRREETKQ